MMDLIKYGSLAAAFVALTGCAATGGETPAVDDDTLEEEASITNGTWTANAMAPSITCAPGGYGASPTSCAYSDLTARATFSGPSGATRRIGVCMLQMTNTPCSGLDAVDTSTGYTGPCSAIAIPAGGYRYCTNINNYGQKYCAFRPGSQTELCGGSPALPWKDVTTGAFCTPGSSPNCLPQLLPPGTYAAPRRTVPNYTKFVSYACFEQCRANDPSVSSASTNVIPGEDVCWDEGGRRTPCM